MEGYQNKSFGHRRKEGENDFMKSFLAMSSFAVPPNDMSSIFLQQTLLMNSMHELGWGQGFRFVSLLLLLVTCSKLVETNLHDRSSILFCFLSCYIVIRKNQSKKIVREFVYVLICVEEERNNRSITVCSLGTISWWRHDHTSDHHKHGNSPVVVESAKYGRREKKKSRSG